MRRRGPEHMPSFIITYDLKATGSPHAEVIKQALAENLLRVWCGGTTVRLLPNTTLWGRFATEKAASDAFNRAVRKAAIVLGHAVVVEKRVTGTLTGAILTDKAKNIDPKWTGSTDFETARLHQIHDPYF